MSHVKEKIILFAVIFFACFLIFFRLTRADFQTDGAFYSMWSVGYLDYLISDNQTTPMQWFDTIPWWSKFSFHAHPPLVFAIQNIFFRAFGESDFIALLPFALAGVGSLILLFLIAKKLYGSNVAILSVFLLGISTFFTWASRINYLEGMVIFFILLTLYLFLKSFENSKYFYLFGAGLGLTFLTKYTTFFLIPFIIAYVFFHDRKYFLHKRFLASLVIAITIFSPVIFYNFILYMTRGHFDVQFSHIIPGVFEAAKKDWPNLFTENEPLNPFQNFMNIRVALGAGYSMPFFITAIIAFFYCILQSLRLRQKHIFILCILFSLVFEFSIMSPNERYMAIWAPFIAMALGVFIYEFCRAIFYAKYVSRAISYIFLSCILIFSLVSAKEIFFNINTNILLSPIGRKGWDYSFLRVENLGFKNLEKRLREIWKNDKLYTSQIKHVRELKDITFTEKNLDRNNVYLYESGLNWFATTWYFEKYHLYHGIVISSDVTLERRINLNTNWFYVLREKGVKNFYFIKGIKEDVFDASYFNDKESQKLSNFLYNNFKEALAKNMRGGIERMYDDSGELSFEILHVNLN